MCGVFGNVTDDDLRATIATLPQLCTPGATVIWTRGRFATGDLAGEIRAWFADGGFEEVAFDAPSNANYRVGTHRSSRRRVRWCSARRSSASRGSPRGEPGVGKRSNGGGRAGFGQPAGRRLRGG